MPSSQRSVAVMQAEILEALPDRLRDSFRTVLTAIADREVTATTCAFARAAERCSAARGEPCAIMEHLEPS